MELSSSLQSQILNHSNIKCYRLLLITQILSCIINPSSPFALVHRRCSSSSSNTRITSFHNNKNAIAYHNDYNRIRINHKLHAVSTSSTPSTNNDIAVDLQHIEFTNIKSTTKYEPVIFIHGLLGSKRNFSYICTSLSRQLKKQRRIIAIDLRNHGDNDSNDWRDTMSYTEMANDVLAFMEKMNFNKVILIGHSMGGKVAKTLALLHPDRISGLVVLDIAPVYYDATKDVTWNGVYKLIHSLNDIIILNGDAKTKKDIDLKLRKVIDDPALRAFVLTNFDNKALRWKINISAIHNQLSVLADFPPLEEKYNGDTFFIHGGSSRFIRSVHMDSIREYFPNHMLTTIRGAGHWVHADAPDDTIALLEKYLDR